MRDELIEAMRAAVDAEYLEIGFQLKPWASRKVAQAALAAIEANGFAVVPGWKDIASAPRDGTQIIAWCVCPTTGDGFLLSDVGYWEPSSRWISAGDGVVLPTHWMPLPDAPLAAAQEPAKGEG